MTAMAEGGRGRAHYGERAEDLAEAFESEIGLLTHMKWRDLELRIEHDQGDIEILNSYSRNHSAWRLPSIAKGSECWAIVQIPMTQAIENQTTSGSALSVEIVAKDDQGLAHQFKGRLKKLPIKNLLTYRSLKEDPIVRARLNELHAARLQMRIRDFALDNNWDEVEIVMKQLEAIAASEPWVASSLEYIRKLQRERDSVKMAKEMYYKASSMRSRITSLDESAYSQSDETEKAAYLRRKTTQGRRSS